MYAMVLHLQNLISSPWGSSTGEEQRESRAWKVWEPCKTRRASPYTLHLTYVFGNRILDFSSFFSDLSFASASSSSEPLGVTWGLSLGLLSSTYTHFPGDFIQPHGFEQHLFAKGVRSVSLVCVYPLISRLPYFHLGV